MILDIVLIILVVIAVIYGLYKGFAGVLLGFIGTLIIAAVLVVGLVFFSPNIMFNDPQKGAYVVQSENGASVEGYTGLFASLYNLMSEDFLDPEDPLLGAELVMVGDILQLKMDDGTTMKFSVALMEWVPFFSSDPKDNGDSGAENVAKPLDENDGEIEGIDSIDQFITKYGVEGLTVGHALAAFTTLVTLCAICWFVAFIVLVIVKIIIRRLIFRALDRHSVASKIDRAIGAVVAVAVVVCVIWLVMSVVGLLSEVDSFQSVLESNPISNFIVEHSMFGAPKTNPTPDGSQDLIVKSVINLLKR